jgi:hypothetical protein
MAMILGAPGTQLIKQLAGQAAGGQVRTAFWGEMVTSSLPKQAVSGIGKQIRDSFIKRFVARQGTSMLGRALPFGIGAAVGGIGNHALGRKVIQASREGFGLPPTQFPMILDQKAPKQLGRGLPWRRKGKQDDAEDTGDQQRRSDTAL